MSRRKWQLLRHLAIYANSSVADVHLWHSQRCLCRHMTRCSAFGYSRTELVSYTSMKSANLFTTITSVIIAILLTGVSLILWAPFLFKRTTATVTNSIVVKVTARGGQQVFRPRLSYTYIVNGKLYESSLISFFVRDYSYYDDAASYIAHNIINGKTGVYYCPVAHSISVVDRSSFSGTRWGCSFLATVFWIALYHKHRQVTQADKNSLLDAQNLIGIKKTVKQHVDTDDGDLRP